MKKSNDILFLCQYFYPEYISSATLPLDTAMALISSGISTSVLCGFPYEYNNSSDIKLKECFEGIRINRIKYIKMNKTKIVGRLVNYFSFTTAMLIRLKRFKSSKISIVYSNPPILPIVAVLAKKIFGTKIIFVSYDVYPEIAIKTGVISENGVICKLMNIINYLLYKNADHVIALSQEMKDYLLRNRNHITDSQISVIPNWHNETNVDNSKRSEKNRLFDSIDTKSKFIVSYFGNLGTAQEVDTIIETIRAFKDKDNIIFLFAGHGNKMPMLKNIVKEEGLLNTHLFDFLHGDDFKEALSISDVYLVSLKQGLSGLAVPSKTYTYLSAGNPIISIMDDSVDLVNDLKAYNAGFNIKPNNVSELVNTIKYLNENETIRAEMGINARKLYEAKYETKISTAKYVQIVSSLLE